MIANTAQNLQRRAGRLSTVGIHATVAKTELAMAVLAASTARADLTIMHDLRTATEALARVTKRAELQRARLLRKAARLDKDHAHG